MFFRIFLCVIALGTVQVRSRAVPSCNLLTFEDDLGDKWQATLNTKVKEQLNGVWIKVDLDGKADVLMTDFGETTSTNNQNFIIRRPDLRLSPGEAVKLKLIAKFGTVEIEPNITRIAINGRIICPPSAEDPDINIRVVENEATATSDDICGTVPEAESLVYNGDLSSEGAWPWHVAIMKVDPPTVKYSCGGSIISEYFILTAAHCVTYPRTKSLYQNNLIYIGVTRLSNLVNPSVKVLSPEETFIHNDYDPEMYFNDLALIKLPGRLQFTKFIRPICLWSEDTDESTITGRKGTVVGWGIDQRNRSFSSDLRHAEIPVVSLQTCKQRGAFYQKHTNDKTFCAGGEEGKAVCNGDSGGGMVFHKPGSEDRTVWQIRGVVSLNQKQEPNAVCNTKGYAIFTDIAKHLKWIKTTANIS